MTCPQAFGGYGLQGEGEDLPGDDDGVLRAELAEMERHLPQRRYATDYGRQRHDLEIIVKGIMKKTGILPACLLLCSAAATALPTQASSNDVAGMMRRVFDWQIANPKRSMLSWYNGTFYAGISAAYRATGDMVYLDALRAVGERNRWKLGRRMRHPDDQCIGQAYLDLYLIDRTPAMIQEVRTTFDTIVADPTPESGKPMLWWWCDALFMGPPVMSRLTAATGESKYLDLMNTMWWKTTARLYDTDEHLFFRDERFLNGKRKIFWSRGNGWVVAGLCRTMECIPENHPDRERYAILFLEMSAKLASLQQDDGFWRSNLLDAARYPERESSGTGFFIYAFAWGINRGLLPEKEYLPVVQRGWNALCSAVNKEGKVEWVQAMGARPDHTRQESSEPYAAGGFLLAGSEVLRLGLTEESEHPRGRQTAGMLGTGAVRRENGPQQPQGR